MAMNDLARHWYEKSPLTPFLVPLSWLYLAAVLLRWRAYRAGLFRVHRLAAPVIVVGNVTAGGAGKTPLVIWMAGFLKQAGYSPGIVARGYRGQAREWPQEVTAASDPVMVGDEAVLLARHCRCPVAVAPDRVAAALLLIGHHRCDVIIADDGLQHYALGRDIEIAVVDGVRRYGNGYCIPAGPLREPLGRLRRADLVVTNGGGAPKGEYSMSLKAVEIRNLLDESRTWPLGDLAGQTVHAVAGIGHPGRFFAQLEGLGIRVIAHPFPDHHHYAASDIHFGDDRAVVMTEKDAVKCRRFARDNCWYLAIAARPDHRVAERLLMLLEKL